MRDAVFVVTYEYAYEGQEVTGAFLGFDAARAHAELLMGWGDDLTITEWHGDDSIARWEGRRRDGRSEWTEHRSWTGDSA